jgi:exopolysaccharide biosynthesis predicted pyruvyltransferase EpsI
MIPVERDVREYLSTSLGKVTCDLLRFPGNYGDALIWHGTRAVLAHAGVTYGTIECDSLPRSRTLLVDGGGNLVGMYRDVEQFLDTYGNWYSQIVILPHTITGATAFASLKRIAQRLTVFCREHVSYYAVRKSLPDAEVYLWHDCAFLAPLSPVQPRTDHETRVLRAFRTDVEALDRPLPEDNRDLSREGYAKSSLDLLVAVLSEHDRVATDRLHIAIAGALLGREVVLYPNIYYKNQAVYEYSLARFPNVHFAHSYLREGTWANGDWPLPSVADRTDSGNQDRPSEARPLVLIESPLGDIVDKLSILLLKLTHISDPNALVHIQSERQQLVEAWAGAGLPDVELLSEWNRLLSINRRIWNLENRVRNCERLGSFGDAFVRAARQIFKLNSARAALKKKINLALGSRIVEQKFYAITSSDTQ